MTGILLTVSGLIDPQIEEKIAHGERPLADYVAMARGFPAELMDYQAARKWGGWIGKVLEKIGGPNLMLAWACFARRRDYDVLFTDGEQVGLPLALLLKAAGGRRRPRHCMIAHRISVPKKMLLMDWLRAFTHIDLFFVYSTWQAGFICTRWKQPVHKVIHTPFMVDARFFSAALIPVTARPAALEGRQGPLISAVGLEYRDYATLLEAVRGLSVQAVVAAASPWSKMPDTTAGTQLPENVLVRRFSQYELRELYAASRFVVMPLDPVDFQAGVTAILEAMAMGKAVICTRTPGQTDVIVDGENGLYVEPGDPRSLRAAIQRLLDHPQEAEQMGRNGRLLVEQKMSLEQYVPRLAKYLESIMPDGEGLHDSIDMIRNNR
jgi:glycosyltransferase involved in cell wall biosynthesis